MNFIYSWEEGLLEPNNSTGFKLRLQKEEFGVWLEADRGAACTTTQQGATKVHFITTKVPLAFGFCNYNIVTVNTIKSDLYT